MVEAGRRALVAEDNSALARVIAFSLRRAGFDVTVAVDGVAAWEHAQAEPVHLVVTDHQMPRMTGVELATKLRAEARYSTTPIVLLTAKGLELDAERLRAELDIAAVLIKPFSPTELGKLVEQLAGQPV